MTDNLRTFYKLDLPLELSAQLSLSPDVVTPLKDSRVSTYSLIFPQQHSNALCIMIIIHSLPEHQLGAGRCAG